MKKLIIVRHAKSSWDLPVLDHHRALMERGINRAQNHAMILKDQLDFIPKYWVSSFANRALHTAVIFSDYFGRVNDLKINKNLYTFNAESLLSQIYHLPDEEDSVILFGHNEACHEVVNQLTASRVGEFKTASVAYITFSANQWNNIQDGNLELLISKGEIVHGKKG